MTSKIISRHYPIVFVLPAFIMFTCFFVIPSIAGFVTSFTDWSIFSILDPSFNGIRNFKDLFASSNFYMAIKNTIYFTVVTTAATIFFGYIFAIILNNQVKLKHLYRTILFSPFVINPIVVALIFSALYHPTLGPINVFLKKIGLGFIAQNWLTDPKIAMLSICLMSIWMGIGGCIVIFLAGLQSVPLEYYESATIDGAGGYQKFRHITFPLTIHSLTINTILALIGGAGVFAQVYGLTNGGPAGATDVYGTFLFQTFSQGLFGYSAAAGLVFTVVISIFSYVVLALFKRLEVEY